MLEYIGWTGAIMFALCGIPQALQSYRDGHTRGMGWGFLAMWFTGEVSMIVYTLPMRDYPLLLNYLGNFAALLVMLKFKIWERKPNIEIDWDSIINRMATRKA